MGQHALGWMAVDWKTIHPRRCSTLQNSSISPQVQGFSQRSDFIWKYNNSIPGQYAKQEVALANQELAPPLVSQIQKLS
jgi:hypothetical protein